jgi:hypothetical protein
MTRKEFFARFEKWVPSKFMPLLRSLFEMHAFNRPTAARRIARAKTSHLAWVPEDFLGALIAAAQLNVRAMSEAPNEVERTQAELASDMSSQAVAVFLRGLEKKVFCSPPPSARKRRKK